MKKLIAIICVLILILAGMYVYKTKGKQTVVTLSNINQIEEYIDSIYLWPEVTGYALPNFENINDAPDIWIWEVVKQSFDEYELTYEQIQNRAIEIFGSGFKKQFPKEGTKFIYYLADKGKYITSGMGLDTEDDRFFIKNIKKTNRGYNVEIVEYTVDYEESMLAYSQVEAVETQEEFEKIDVEYDIYVKNLNNDIIATLKNKDDESKIIETVKNNIDKFSTKTISLIKDNDKIYVESVK